jgi:hypothetical protein
MQKDSTSTQEVNREDNIIDFPNCESNSAVARTAQEIRALFLKSNLSPRVPYKIQAISVAITSEMSDGAFRLFVAREIYADKDGLNSCPSQETLAALMGCGVKTIHNLEKEIKSLGFMKLARRANSRARNPLLRSASYNMIDDASINRIAAEISVNDRKEFSGRNGKNTPHDQKEFSGHDDRKEFSGHDGEKHSRRCCESENCDDRKNVSGHDDRKNDDLSTGKDFPPINSYTPKDYTIGGRARDEHSFAKAAAGIAATFMASTGCGATDPANAMPIDPPAYTQQATTTQNFAELERKLIEAAGNALANPAASPGLLVLSEPYRWLDAGCDLERDVLPTIKARSVNAPRGSIRSWSYFTQAVANAKAAREKAMPEANAAPAKRKPRKSNYDRFGRYIGPLL